MTFIGEYFGLDASPHGFHVLWTDTRTGMQELFTSHVLLSWIFRHPPLPLSYVEILFGIVNDGGGLGRTPDGKPVPEPPWGPDLEMIKCLAIDGLAQSMSGRSGLDIRRAALSAIERTARGALGELGAAGEVAPARRNVAVPLSLPATGDLSVNSTDGAQPAQRQAARSTP